MSAYNVSFARLVRGYEHWLFISLRLALALIFIWFGVLKIFGFNPVYDLIYHSMLPVLATGTGLVVLGVFETLLGILLLLNKYIHLTHFLLVVHLLGTFSTFVFGWNVVFDPYFPVLSLSGEFVVKNITLVIAALVVLVFESKKLI